MPYSSKFSTKISFKLERFNYHVVCILPSSLRAVMTHLYSICT